MAAEGKETEFRKQWTCGHRLDQGTGEGFERKSRLFRSEQADVWPDPHDYEMKMMTDTRTDEICL
jgi:hypothetical protein